MYYLIISILGMLLGCWALYRLLTIHPIPDQTEDAFTLRYSDLRGEGWKQISGRTHRRGLVLPANMVGTSYRTQHPNFWTEEEP